MDASIKAGELRSQSLCKNITISPFGRRAMKNFPEASRSVQNKRSLVVGRKILPLRVTTDMPHGMF
jgi:hypothetical protein